MRRNLWALTGKSLIKAALIIYFESTYYWHSVNDCLSHNTKKLRTDPIKKIQGELLKDGKKIYS